VPLDPDQRKAAESEFLVSWGMLMITKGLWVEGTMEPDPMEEDVVALQWLWGF
jgi:hypothetical protein